MDSFNIFMVLLILLIGWIFGQIAKYITKIDFGFISNLMIGLISAVLGEIIDFNIFRGWAIGLIFGVLCTVVLFFMIRILSDYLE